MKNNFIPLVSIIIPVYNGERYLREAVDSALNQTYENIEVVIVNDGSLDNSEKIIRSYGKRVLYFKKNNEGVSTALNLGIKESKGDYISWLSHDDVYYPDKIEKQISVLNRIDKNKRGKTILYSNWVLIDKNSRRFDEFRIEKIYDVKKLNYPLYPILKCIVHGGTLLIPRKCFDTVGLFDPKLKTTQDYDMWFRMLPKYDLLFQSKFFVKFRYHKKQGSNIIRGAKAEADVFWLKMVKSLSDDEKASIDGSVKCFYKRMIRFTHESKYVNTEKYLTDRFRIIGGRLNKIEEWFIKIKDRIINKARRVFFLIYQ